MPDLDKHPLDDLEKRISETARSRFIASSRLSKRDERISWIVAMASAYTIILTVIPYFVRLPTDTSDLLNLATVGLSIVTLVSSLIVSSRRDAVNAEQHHRSALELNELKRQITLLKFRFRDGAVGSDEIEKLYRKYDNVLQKYSINHSPEDYDKLKLERPQDYPWIGHFDRTWLQIKILMSSNRPIFTMILLTIAVAILVLHYALPSRLPSR